MHRALAKKCWEKPTTGLQRLCLRRLAQGHGPPGLDFHYLDSGSEMDVPDELEVGEAGPEEVESLTGAGSRQQDGQRDLPVEGLKLNQRQGRDCNNAYLDRGPRACDRAKNAECQQPQPPKPSPAEGGEEAKQADDIALCIEQGILAGTFVPAGKAASLGRSQAGDLVGVQMEEAVRFGRAPAGEGDPSAGSIEDGEG